MNNMDARGTRENIQIINEIHGNGMRVEVLEYQSLLGMSDTKMASTMYFMSEQNMKVRQVAIYLDNSSCKIEPGAMSYFQGPMTMESGVTMGNMIGRAFKGAVTGEAMASPEYTGSGMLVLEPTFRHIILVTLEKGESIVVDKGMFYAAQGTVKVEPIMQKNISSGLFGGEGLFQIGLTGPGLAVLECEVPMEEIDVINLENDTLKVDGSFAVLRDGGLSFTVEKSSGTLIGSAMSGEGLVNVFKGTGQVWLAPTIKVYDTLKMASSLNITNTANMNMNTSNNK